MRKREAGFTIIEVLVAILILSIGVLALSSTAGGVTRMMYGGRAKSNAAAMGQSILDSMRTTAQMATPTCTGLVGGTRTSNRMTASWAVTSVPGPGVTSMRTVSLRLQYQIGVRAAADTLRTTIFCP